MPILIETAAKSVQTNPWVPKTVSPAMLSIIGVETGPQGVNKQLIAQFHFPPAMGSMTLNWLVCLSSCLYFFMGAVMVCAGGRLSSNPHDHIVTDREITTGIGNSNR